LQNEEQILNYVLKTFDNYKSHRKQNFDNRFIESYKLYKSYRNSRQHEWQSNVFLPYSFSMIETVLPREVEYLWRGDKLVKAFPRERTDIPFEEVVNDLIYYQIDTQIDNLFMEMVEHFKQTLVYGTGIGVLTWNVNKNKPEFNSIDILDFYGQPHKKYIEDMDGCFRVYDRYIDYLWQLQQQGIGYINIDKMLREQDQQNVNVEDSKKDRLAVTGQNPQTESNRPSALIYEYWGKVPVQNRIDVDAGITTAKYDEMLVMIANRKYLIRAIPNPYRSNQNPEGFRPFIVGKNYLDIGEFYSMGEIDNVKDIQHELNELENQSLDNIKLIMNRMWKVSTSAGVDLSTLVSMPGGVVIGNDINQIEQMDHNDLPPSGAQMQERLNNALQMASGVSDYTRGVNSPGMTDTVGGISALVEESNMRFSLKIKILQMTSVRQFAEKLFQLDQLFIDSAELPVRLEGQEGLKWVMVNKDNLKGMYDFKPVGISLIGNKIARQNTLIRMLDVLAKAPPIPGLIKQILDEFEFPNTEEIMQQMQNLWGQPLASLESPSFGSSMGGMGAGGNPSAPPPLPPLNNIQEAQGMSNQLAANTR
jgi:hypothetical protein